MAHRSRFLDYSPRMSMQSKEIKLKLWVFKIVFGQFEVCVEGYRPKDREETELKCWHSTAIADRLNSCTLQTNSGSIYILHGPMDIDAAQTYGYPDDLIEAFKDGFPPNWRELLTDFHAMLVRSSQCDVSQWFNSSLMVERRRSSTNFSRRQSTMFPSLTDAVNKFSRDKQLAPVDRRSFRSRQSFVIPASAPMTPVVEDRSAERDQGEHLLGRTDKSPVAAVHQTSLTPVRSSPRLSRAAPVQQVVEVAQIDEVVIAEATSPTQIGPAIFESTKMDSPPANDENQPPPNAIEQNVFKMPTLPAPKPRKGKNVPTEVAPKAISPDLDVVPKVVLQDWVFKLVNGDFAVCLEGYRTDAPDKCWHSTAIVERVSARLLKTGSGTVYGLEGPIDTKASADPYGYPKYLVALFENGFPVDWKEILVEFYESRVQTNQTNISQWYAVDEPVDQSMMEATLPLAAAVDRVSRQKQLEVVSSNDADGSEQASSSTKSSKKLDDAVFVKPSMPAPKPVKKQAQKKWDCQSVHSDFGEVSARLSASADGDHLFRASRSGRVIKPPLASWAGQRITYDQDGKAKHIVDPITQVATQQNGFSLAALCQVYGVSPVRQPMQQERRISMLQPLKKKKRRSGQHSSRTVDDSSDESSASSLSSSDESDSPIGKRRNKTARFRFDDSVEYEREREVRRQRRKEKRRRRKEREMEKLKQKKVKRAQSTTSRSRKRRSPVVKKPPRAKSTTSKVSRSTKGRGKATKSTASHRRRSPSPSSSASQSRSPSPPSKKAKKPAAKRWTNEEYKRLQIALRAVLPRDDDGWNKVANSLGGDRTAAQCQNAANRVLGYDLQLQEEDLPQSAAPQITAKVGTAAYQVQANRYLRSYLHGTGDDDDYFENTCDMAASTLALPSLGDLNPNDSLLSVMFTPTNVPRGKNRVFVPRPASTPGSALMSPSYDQSPADRKARYAHQLQQDRMERLAMIGRMKPSRESFSAAHKKKEKQQQDEMLSRYLNDVRRKQQDEDDEESENDDQYFSEEGDSD